MNNASLVLVEQSKHLNLFFFGCDALVKFVHCPKISTGKEPNFDQFCKFDHSQIDHSQLTLTTGLLCPQVETLLQLGNFTNCLNVSKMIACKLYRNRASMT